MQSKDKEQAARKLTMEEKRRLEKMIFADIDTAKNAYQAKRRAVREQAKAKLLKSVPAAVRQMFAAYCAAKKTAAEAEKKLDGLGYDISTGYNSEEPKLTLNSYQNIAPELKEFDRDTNSREGRFEIVKRNYTIKLFAGGAEAQEIFAGLQAELAKLIDA